MFGPPRRADDASYSVLRVLKFRNVRSRRVYTIISANFILTTGGYVWRGLVLRIRPSGIFTWCQSDVWSVSV